jgi:hypothetical protein
MKLICQDLLSQISRLSLEVEEERSQRIQIESEYETQLTDATAKFTKKCQQLKQMLRDNKAILPKQQQLICKQINSKLMGEQSSPSLKPFANEANAQVMPKAVQSTNAVLQQSISQIHTVAGSSYNKVNFPLLNEVANKYKSFEVHQKNGTTRNISIPVT